LQKDVEDMFNKYILQSETYELSFKNIDFRDIEAITTRLVSMVQNAMATPNEARNELGMKPYPGGDVFYIGTSFIDVGESAEPLAKNEDDDSE